MPCPEVAVDDAEETAEAAGDGDGIAVVEFFAVEVYAGVVVVPEVRGKSDGGG